MTTYIYTPARSVLNHLSPGVTDTRQQVIVTSGSYPVINTIYTFMGAPVLSVSATQGFNGSPSSLDVTLVEDPDLGLYFTPPINMPEVWAFALPKGGVNQQYFNTSSEPNLNPSASGFLSSPYASGVPAASGIPYDPVLSAFYPENVPFYFCGFVTNYSKDMVSPSARTIRVQLVDPSEILRGVQVLLNGFALSHNVGAGQSRYTGISNVIDAFGFFEYGMESGVNEFGMPWNKIKTVLNNIKCTIFDVDIEFLFTGECFNSVPDWYRVSGNVVDFVSLCNKVASDGGSDVVYVARKINSLSMIVEVRGIRRKNADVLTQSEITDFLASHDGIVTHASVGKELRNTATSKMIAGGNLNKNYVAYPTKFNHQFRASGTLMGQSRDGLIPWPDSIASRLFGDPYEMDTGYDTTTTVTPTVEVGAIFPFWGYAPDGQTPLIEPFLPLEHISFNIDHSTSGVVQPSSGIPLCHVETVFRTVRDVTDGASHYLHPNLFLDNDGGPDDRPFAHVTEYEFTSVRKNGWMRGIPLNQEILAASLLGREFFFLIYRSYFPDIADSLSFPAIDTSILDYMKGSFDQLMTSLGITGPAYFDRYTEMLKKNFNLIKYVKGNKTTPGNDDILLDAFRDQIRVWVKNYATDYLGKQFIVCLPRSEIMNRIFNGLPVPTRIERPEIEYRIDQSAYWQDVPTEFQAMIYQENGDPLTIQQMGPGSSGTEASQIRDRFMKDDGRFDAMFVMNTHPSGNGSIFSDGHNEINLTEYPTESYRPNRLETLPERIYISPSIVQLTKRPDLALVSVEAVKFDPNSTYIGHSNVDESDIKVSTNYWAYTRGRICHMLWQIINKDIDVRSKLQALELKPKQKSDMVNSWADYVINNNLILEPNSGEYDAGFAALAAICLDPEAIIIPLTSNWVTYGPWWSSAHISDGLVDIDVDESLVPWNFTRPNISDDWDTNLNEAGLDKLDRTLCKIDYTDKATITCAGLPEFGLAYPFGFNNNLTGISVNFDVQAITTTYSFSSYDRKPGTFRRTDFDNISASQFRFRKDVPTTVNTDLGENYRRGWISNATRRL